MSRILEAVEAGTLRPGFETSVQSGSARGVVSVSESADDPGVEILIVRLPVMRVPETSREDLYARLLQFNSLLKGRAGFSVTDQATVELCAGRNLRDLEPNELIDLIIWTAEQADHYDDRLLSEFGFEHSLGSHGDEASED